MTRKIHLKQLYNCPSADYLGIDPTEKDYDEIIREDCDVYLPDGTLALSFRKQALKSVLDIRPGSKDYEYWKWACKALLGDQRGMAAGRDICTNVEIRLTVGQCNFFSDCKKGKIKTLEDARKVLDADPQPSRKTYYINKVESDGLVDLDEIEKWDSLVRKKSTPMDLRQEAYDNRNAAKLAWFENWLTNKWANSEDKMAEAARAQARYVTSQPRGNKVFSAVLGVIDRSGRMPFGRLTVPTLQKYDDFERFSYLYQEVDKKVKECLPEQWEILTERFQKVKDKKYNLFGTVFTSITCNYNFQVKYHYDGNNAKNAVAALTVFENGEYDGMEFVLPEIRLAFDIRHGDLLCGDNQGLMHAMLPMKPKDPDAECLMLVFYQRDRVVDLDDLECEQCRKDFMAYAVQNHPEKSTGEPKWTGSWAGMWGSPEWVAYKKLRGLDHCSNTNYYCKEDK